MKSYYFKKTAEGCVYIKTPEWKHLDGTDTALACLMPNEYDNPVAEAMKIVNDLNNGSPKRLLFKYYETPTFSKQVLKAHGH